MTSTVVTGNVAVSQTELAQYLRGIGLSEIARRRGTSRQAVQQDVKKLEKGLLSETLMGRYQEIRDTQLGTESVDFLPILIGITEKYHGKINQDCLYRIVRTFLDLRTVFPEKNAVQATIALFCEDGE